MISAILILILCLFWLRIRYEAGAYEINRHVATLRKPLRRPLSVLHLSDIHFSGPDKKLAKFFDRLAAETYDFIFISGDIIDCTSGIPFCIENLKKLRAHAGVWAVLGNHDYYDYDFFDILFHNFPGQARPHRFIPMGLFIQALGEVGVRVLRNETARTEWNGQPFLIHGLDDATTGRANVRTAMANFDPGKINILLTHSIDVFLDIGRNEIDISFSGHSHGGQFRFPFIGALYTHTTIGRSYSEGIRRLKGAVCSISRGLGASRFFRVRFRCKPEAVVLTVFGPA